MGNGAADVPHRPSLAGLDRVRATAALGVVLLHACVPYLSNPMPGLIWPVKDAASATVDWLFWGIEVFIMPVFLVLAGYLLYRSSLRQSEEALLRSRAKRLLVPLGFGLVVILPIDLYLWTLGLVIEGAVPAVKLKSFKFESPIGDAIWGTAHLWFLSYVFSYVAVFAALLRCKKRSIRFGIALRSVTKPRVVLPVLFGVAVGAVFVSPEVVWGFQHGFLPYPSKWCYCAAFFAAGWFLGSWDRELVWLKTYAFRTAALGVLFLVAAIALGRWHLQQGGGASELLVLAVVTTTAAISTTLGVLGFAVRSDAPVGRSTRYLAAASFWIYLVHHPVVGLTHIDLKWLLPEAAPIVKLMLSFMVTTAFCLASYELLIVRTRLGLWLGFRSITSVEVVPETVAPAREFRRAA
ncbi:MAG: acyltransferase [Planctomycetota bacterium]